MTTAAATQRRRFSGTLRWGGYLTGGAMGGFFDGILLHQVLQWHHLLSGVEGEYFRDLRVQVFADGMFHVLMYIVAGVGLWLMWRARRELAEPGGGRALLVAFLVGFGVWHILDVVLFHWIMGIHRIRMETAVPLLYDIGWMVIFGGLGLLAAWWAARRSGTGGGGRAAAGTLAAAIVVAGPIAMLPPPDVTSALVLFRPGTSGEQVLAAAAAVNARVMWSDRSGEVWVLDLPEPGSVRRLYGMGALLVSRAGFPAGCFTWSREA